MKNNQGQPLAACHPARMRQLLNSGRAYLTPSGGVLKALVPPKPEGGPRA